MALTRKMLKAMGIEDEKIDQIIEAHGETVDALKSERDQYKDAAEKLPGVQAELEALKAKPGDGFKEKYAKEHEAFEAYKSEVEAEKAANEKKSLYRGILTQAGIDPKRIDAVLRVADLAKLEVKDGAIVDSDKVMESVKSEWSDFIQTTAKKPANVQNPPKNVGGEKEPSSLAEALRLRYQKE